MPALFHRPLLTFSLLLTTLLLLSSLHRPSPHSPKFQFPGLLPSHLNRDTFSSDNLIYQTPHLRREQERRYAHLRKPRIPGPGANRMPAGTKGKYLFTTLTRDIEGHLPDLINAIIVLVNFLGKDHVRFSFYEGPSSDKTSEILRETLLPLLRHMGVPDDDVVMKLDRPAIDFNMVNRIQALAVLRNEALAPLWTTPGWGESTVAVVFFNDVYLRARDVLELLHQHVKAGEKAGMETAMTTGLDWYRKHPEYYYDVWAARTMDGDLFYPVSTPYWIPSDDFLSTAPAAKDAYDHLRPFQAFSSWAGMAVMAATPFLPPHSLRFRRSDPKKEDECAGSECEMICRDFWSIGWGRIQVIPSVQLAYERDVALDIVKTVSAQMKDLKFYEETPDKWDDQTITWQKDPPSQVKCHPWPEGTGTGGNIWETVNWGPPYVGYGA